MTIFVAIIFVFLAVVIINLGVKIEKKTTPKAIVTELLDNAYSKIIDFFDTRKINESFNYKSRVVVRNKVTDNDDLNANYTFLKHLFSEVKDEDYYIDLDFDRINKQILFKFEEALLGSTIKGKYLIKNATSYYYLEDILNRYVNDGSNNYFENISSNLLSDNLDYLREFIYASLKDNLKDSYFTKYDDMITLNDKKQKVYKITLKINNKILKEVEKNIYQDIRSSPKALQIMSSFSKRLAQENIYFLPLEDNESFVINVYIDKIFNKLKRLEVANLLGDEESKMTYSVDQDKLLYFTTNEWIDFIFKLDDKEISILDKNNKKIGSLNTLKNANSKSVNFYLNDEDNNVELVYEDKYDGSSGDFKNTKLFTLKIARQRSDIIDFSYSATSNYSDVNKIEEDLSNVILKSSISKEEQAKMDDISDDSKFLKMIR